MDEQKIKIQLRENLLAVEEDRATGRTGCTVDELDGYLDGILNEAPVREKA